MVSARSLVLGIIASCALLMVAIGSASAAEPAFYECAKVAKSKVTKKFEGGYENGCQSENPAHEGEYEFREWNKGPKKVRRFKSKGSLSGTFELPHVSTVECTHTGMEGELTGPKTADNIKITLSHCLASSRPCENTVAVGEIITNMLRGEIGYVNKAQHEVGLDLQSQTGGPLTELHCGAIPEPILRIRVTGSTIGRIAPVDEFTKNLTIDFEAKDGEQVIPLLEGMTEPDVPIVESCRSKEVCEPIPTEGALSMEGILKTEYIYLKA